MKTHHQNTWQFAKLILAALVFAFGAVTCSGGGGGGSSGGGGGGSTANINPDGYQLAITSVDLAASVAQQSGAGARVARSDFVATADASLRLSVTVRNSGNRPSPSDTSFILYRSDDAALASNEAIRTYLVGAVAAGDDEIIVKEIAMPTLSTSSLTHFIVAGDFAGEVGNNVDDDFLGIAVTSTDGSDISNSTVIQGSAITREITRDWSASGAVVSKSSASVGERITLSVDVANKSAFRAPRASLSFYRSGSSAITFTDTGVGVASISALAAGDNKDVSLDVSVPSTEGTYYYGACIVSADDTDASNNCSTGVAVAVTASVKYGALAFGTTGSDFFVGIDDWFTGTSVDQLTPAAAHSEAVRLCIADGGSSGGCEVLVTFTAHIAYAAGDHTGDDGVVAWATANTLSAAQTAAIAECQRAGGKTSGEGACEPLGTFIDGYDSSHSNSPATDGAAKTGSELIQYGWDIAVDISVSNSTLTPNQAFTLSALVINDDDVAAPAFILTYYLSSDAVLSADDTRAGINSIPSLSPDSTSPQSISLTAPTDAGRYYYIACAPIGDIYSCDDVSVTVGSGQFDLSVTDLSASSSSVAAGGGLVTLSGTVTNAASSTISSPVAGLIYYYSTDATITTSDIYVGDDGVSILSPGRTSSISISVPTPYSAGTYYFGACLADKEGYRDELTDSNTSNNCSTGVQVEVTSAGVFDLSVTDFSLNPVSVAAGGIITFHSTVTNAASSNTSSPIVDVGYRRSTDATITPASDNAFESSTVYLYGVKALAASETYNESGYFSAPASAGTYYYGACVNASGDNDTTNNCSSGVQVTVTSTATFDLSVTTFSVSNTSVSTGDSITLSATVGNASSATVSSPAAYLNYYLSTDATITTDGASADEYLGYVDVSALAASATSDLSASFSAPSSAGTYYYGACITHPRIDSINDNDDSNDCAVVEVEVTVTGGGTTTKYGALAFEETADDLFAGTSVNQPTQAAAHTEAIRLCSVDGGTNCAVQTTFTAHIAYAGGVHTDGTKGILAWATRNTLSTAETAAVAECQSAGGKTSGEGACALLGTFDDESTSSYSNSPATAGTEEAGSALLAFDEITPPRAPTATPSSLSSAGYFEFNVVVAGDFSGQTLVFRQSSDATITSSDATVTARSRNVVSTGIDDDATTEITAEVYAASTGYYGVCAGSVCSDGVQVTVSGGGG